MSKPLYALILAGGSGERFWPLSRRTRPKQLLKLVSDKTLLEETIDRLEGLVPPERILVLTNVDQENAVRAFLASHVDTAHDVQLQVDGRSVSNVAALRVSGDVGACTIPDDNIFGAPFAPGPHPCVADGYWALLQPLAKGSHTIRFSGGLAADGFTLDVTYHVTVSGR